MKQQLNNIEVEAQTLRRLESIRTPDESPDDTLNRLLDDAVKNVPIEEIMTDLLDQFEDAVSISVDMEVGESPVRMDITVYTGSVDMEEGVNLYEGVESRAVIDAQSGDQFHLPFRIHATSSGPRRESVRTTPVYMTDNVLGLDAVTLEQGLNRLREKIGKSHEEVRELVHEF